MSVVNTALRVCFFERMRCRDAVGEVQERRSDEPCSGAAGRMQKPFCTRSTTSQAAAVSPNKLSQITPQNQGLWRSLYSQSTLMPCRPQSSSGGLGASWSQQESSCAESEERPRPQTALTQKWLRNPTPRSMLTLPFMNRKREWIRQWCSPRPRNARTGPKPSCPSRINGRRCYSSFSSSSAA